jgi:hypothetical protein
MGYFQIPIASGEFRLAGRVDPSIRENVPSSHRIGKIIQLNDRRETIYHAFTPVNSIVYRPWF